MPFGDVLDEKTEALAKEILTAALTVHKTLGPGLLESIYESCLALELKKRGLEVQRQVYVPIIYEGQEIEPGLRLDLLVNNCIIVEVKAAIEDHPVFRSQLVTYLKLSNLHLGLIINFNVPLLKDGLKRVIR